LHVQSNFYPKIHALIPKQLKQFGQHFLNRPDIIQRIVDACLEMHPHALLEIGPGPGVLTRHLAPLLTQFKVAEIDTRMVEYLKHEHIVSENQIIAQDVLSLDPRTVFESEFWVVGNFPYNISSQIMHWIIGAPEKIPGMTGMFQKEVAKRICASPNSRDYGSLTVMIQWFYSTEYLFDVPADAFDPPPKVVSGVMRMYRREKLPADFPVPAFFKFVKACFALKRRH